MNNLDMLLSDDVPTKEKSNVFLETVKLLQTVEGSKSYQDFVESLLPDVERNVLSFEEKQDFSRNEIESYVQKYKKFYTEYMKYQVWLVGTEEDCEQVEKLLNYEKVHLLGRFTGGYTDDAADCIIVCSDVSSSELSSHIVDKKASVIRYDYIRKCIFGISVESTYLDMEIRRRLDQCVEGAVTGLSYQQRGINFDKLNRNIVCLFTPAQDFFLDYHNFLWLYDEVVVKRQGLLKYCIIGMDFYRLWYDLSLSNNKLRMLCFYRRIRNLHHLEWDVKWLSAYEAALKSCEELMIDDYMDKDYMDNFRPELHYGKIEKQYNPTEQEYEEDIKEIKKIFDKNYPLTFAENIGILERYLKFLHLHDIKTLVFIPPFPKVFNDYTPAKMKGKTLEVLSELKTKFNFEILDLSDSVMFENHHFADWSHLNDSGADMVTKLLNEFMDEVWN